jgi:hypothetical protein
MEQWPAKLAAGRMTCSSSRSNSAGKRVIHLMWGASTWRPTAISSWVPQPSGDCCVLCFQSKGTLDDAGAYVLIPVTPLTSCPSQRIEKPLNACKYNVLLVICLTLFTLSSVGQSSKSSITARRSFVFALSKMMSNGFPYIGVKTCAVDAAVRNRSLYCRGRKSFPNPRSRLP